VFQFEIDFDLLYPEQKLKAYNSYKDFCDRIIQALTNEESKCEALKDNLLLVTSDDISEGNIKDVILFPLKNTSFFRIQDYFLYCQ
jgi:hypothetical protein